MVNNLIERPQFGLSTCIAKISANDYIRDYRDSERFIKYCRQCSRYGKTYSCPPFDFDTDEYISGYRDVYIIGTKVVFDEATRQASTTIELRDAISHNAMYMSLDSLEESHNRLLAKFPDTISFLVGKCRVCDSVPCARPQGLPCRHPDRVRHSIESVGFDVGKTTSQLLGIELKWSSDHQLPEYITLVTALFTCAASDKFIPALCNELGVPPEKVQSI